MRNSHQPDSDSSLAERTRSKAAIALGVEWVARITAVGLLMVLPGVLGSWLDSWLGVKFLTLVGFAFGFVAGFVALLAMVKPKKSDHVSNGK